MSLQFKDIQDWKPSTISIVDIPSHPLAVFEVYDDDEEFVKKFVEDDNMVNKNTEATDVERNVSMSESFFEKLFGGVIAKAAPEPPVKNEPPAQPPVKGQGEEDDIKTILTRMETKIDGIDERVTKLEGEKPPEKPPEQPPKEGDPVPGAVKKSTEEPPTTGDNNVVTEEGTVNDNAVVSKSIDPDLAAKNTTSEKSFMERIGRSNDGMKW